MNLLLATSLLALLLVAHSVAADEPLWKFPQLPVDSRFVTVHDLDHPAKFAPSFRTREQWEARAIELRRQVQVALGLWPMPPRPPIKPVIWGKVDHDGYTIEKVYFASREGHYVTGNLYRPAEKRGPFPIVLTPHGHWENGRLMERKPDQIQNELDSGAEQTREGAMYPLQARCAGLARMGCVVFIYDMIGMGDSAPIAHSEGFRDAEAELRLQSAMGLQTWSSIRALDFVCALPDVDTKRVAVTGESGGGTQTIFLCALDDRVTVSVPCVMVSGNMQGGCVCENASLLRIDTNNIELAALFAPKPLCAIGADDWTSDIETVGYPELQRIYGLYGATTNVLAKHFAFPHNINQVSREFVYGWINRHFKLGLPEPIHEKPFEPLSPAQLSVFDADQPRPTDALDAKALRAAMTRESDEQLNELRRDPKQFRDVMREALRVMLHEPSPASAIVVPGSERTLQGDGCVVHQCVLARPGEDAVVPIIEMMHSDAAPSRTVIWNDPKGAASLFEPDGQTPIPPIRTLLDRGDAVIAPEVFLTGQSQRPSATTRPVIKGEEKFAGYRYGYNRTLLADRAHDLLTVIAYAKSRSPKQIALVGMGRAGIWTLLARDLVDDVHTAVIDLAKFDFDQVTRADDEMFLPGALKHGGVMSFAALCEDGRTVLFNPPAHAATGSAPLPEKKTLSADEIVTLLAR
jgi:dienelactone hydrolase